VAVPPDEVPRFVALFESFPEVTGAEPMRWAECG
jgi:hypothetical protein